MGKLEIYKASHISDIINEQLPDNSNQLYKLTFKVRQQYW